MGDGLEWGEIYGREGARGLTICMYAKEGSLYIMSVCVYV